MDQLSVLGVGDRIKCWYMMPHTVRKLLALDGKEYGARLCTWPETVDSQAWKYVDQQDQPPEYRGTITGLEATTCKCSIHFDAAATLVTIASATATTPHQLPVRN